jgi:hypothetical protein
MKDPQDHWCTVHARAACMTVATEVWERCCRKRLIALLWLQGPCDCGAGAAGQDRALDGSLGWLQHSALWSTHHELL